ncbi:hypothetical protein EXIGLDRAFT_716478 [Exidia glandulosa HHB12029]|uniref:Uncharacterized protein n=1 Tax=Exidia glandulosa HHB12029 TaxID=1314781 RepID=A0A165P9D0_EXIGL|nr:hypothetical protein EXIGLDRAFT_716478 [Exidia glandulosa HHB12029]
MFHDPSRAELTLILREEDGQAALPPFHILSDLTHPTEFHCRRAAADGVVTCFTLQDGGHAATGRRRRFREIRTRKRDHFPHVWQSINAAALLSIVVDLDVWMDLAPVPALPAVQRIDFIIHAQSGETVHPPVNRAEWSPSLPMLDEVRFINADDNDIAFDAGELEIFLGALRSDTTPVPVVTFEHVSVIRAVGPATVSLQS